MKHADTKRRIYETDGPGHVYHIDGNDKLKGMALQSMVGSTDLVERYCG